MAFSKYAKNHWDSWAEENAEITLPVTSLASHVTNSNASWGQSWHCYFIFVQTEVWHFGEGDLWRMKSEEKTAWCRNNQKHSCIPNYKHKLQELQIALEGNDMEWIDILSCGSEPTQEGVVTWATGWLLFGFKYIYIYDIYIWLYIYIYTSNHMYVIYCALYMVVPCSQSFVYVLFLSLIPLSCRRIPWIASTSRWGGQDGHGTDFNVQATTDCPFRTEDYSKFIKT